jgi:peptide-methionine (S)-S-oxide reductase
MDPQFEQATLGGGCFWCLEPVFEALEGVESVVVGYAGGQEPDPTYHQVGTGRTGHAEVVQIEFDPQRVSYRDLLEVFFAVHDPTTLDRQGADVGPQYRSIILHHSVEQQRAAAELIQELGAEGLWEAPIVTQIEPFTSFHLAEDYHQDYYANNPTAGYCLAVISPKMAKFRKRFSAKMKPEPTTVR